MVMNKKQQLKYLLEQIDRALVGEVGDYHVIGDQYLFSVPGFTTVWRIQTTPEKFKQQLLKFAERLKKSDAFKNKRGVPQA